ncbi:MAG TPA: 2-dehydropantoate 2-reductase [Usitatibacter sp.]|nr:2-dehydropantoate 2-reductase [Usitatibacter sp.]
MKIAMMGSGGVGGFFGAHLARTGCDVTFIARGAHLQAMRERGLTVESPAQGDIHIPGVKVTDDPASVGVVDIVILSVKLWDTESAARSIAPMVGPATGVLSLQNGVIKDDILRRVFPAQQVMGGVAYVATTVARPGVIHQTGTMQRIVVGEYDQATSERARFLYQALLAAGITAELSADVRRSLWEKYVFLVGLSGTTATTRLPLGAVRANPRTRAFLQDLMQETVTVGRAHGVALPEDYARQRMAFADTLPYDMTSSMHHDLQRGNPLEVEWLSGGVVQLGQVKGIETPVNRGVWDALALHAQGKPRAAA